MVFRSRYDAASNLIEERDALDYPTKHDYDKLNRRAETINAENGQTDYVYDHVGNLTGLTSPRRYSTAFEYTRDNLLKLAATPKAASSASPTTPATT